MQRQRLIIIIGAILGLIAVFLAKVYLDQQRRAIEEAEKRKVTQIKENLVPVLVAKKDIPKGAEVEAESLDVETIPKEYLQPQAATSLDRVAGMKTLAAISKGEQITLSKLTWAKPQTLTEPGSASFGSLALNTPVGKRAVTIAVDSIASLGGMIKPGDYVDIISVIPIPVTTPDKKQVVQPTIIPLFQNVLVLAVGREVGRVSSPAADDQGRYAQQEKQPEKSGSSSPSMITLALEPEQANIVAFVQEQGKFRLVLRSPADSKVEVSSPTTWETFFKYVMPPSAQPEEQVKEEPKEAVEYLEVYRGLNKELVPLSK